MSADSAASARRRSMSRHACASDRTQVWAQNEPDQAQEVPGGELSVVVRALDKRLHGTAPAHTAAQAMGSRLPGVLCHALAWQGRRSRKRQASMCSCWPLWWWSLSISSTLRVACCALILMMTVSSCSEKWRSNALDPVAIFTVWRTVCWRGRCAGCRCDVAARRLVCAARCVV